MAIAKSGAALGKNEKILLTMVMVLAITFLYWTFLLKPALTKIKPLQDEVNSLKAQTKNTSTIQSNIKEKEKELENLKVEYEKATKVISKTDRYPELVKEIREIASANSLKISNENLGIPTVYTQVSTETNSDTTKTQVSNPAAGLKTITMDLTLEGGFNNILAFIDKLEQDKRILEVKSFLASDKSTTVNLIYYIAGGEETESYDFNTGSYGKDNLFN